MHFWPSEESHDLTKVDSMKIGDEPNVSGGALREVRQRLCGRCVAGDQGRCIGKSAPPLRTPVRDDKQAGSSRRRKTSEAARFRAS